jgi:hypothetical protein
MRVLQVYQTPVSSGTWYIQVLIYTNFAIRRFEKDSPNHLLYLTKNVWLSGAFLNGYFKGVWNDGLFKGWPNITEIQDSHFINGKFDGGHFISTTVPTSTYIGTTWSTGLVQNFTFIDNNVAPAYKFLYESWMDINWSNDIQTNLYQDKNYYDGSSDNTWRTETTLSKANLNGFVTSDILSSLSYFRNGYDTNVKSYSLGTKYKIYQDYLDTIGNFSNMFSNDTGSYPRLGVSSFVQDGWTFKSVAMDFGSGRRSEAGINSSGTYSEGYITSMWPGSVGSESGLINVWPDDYKVTNVDSTLSITSPNKLTLGTFSTQHTWNDVIPGGSSDLHTFMILNNTNTYNIPDSRYSMIQFNILSFTGFPGPAPYSSRAYNGGPGSDYIPPTLSFGIDPATYSLTPWSYNPLYTQDSSGNWVIDSSGQVKTGYFYNRHSLLLEILGSDYVGTVAPTSSYPVGIDFDNIHFYEVDMIPFFFYATASNIDMNIKTPFVGIAPQIDYSNSAFDFVGNVSISIDSSGVAASVGGGVSLGTFVGTVGGGVSITDSYSVGKKTFP